MLLDQDGFECDPISRVEGDTPLHSAVRYVNTLTESSPLTPEISEYAKDFIGMMLEAGSDPRIRNKANLTAYQLTDPRNEKLKQQLQDAVDIMQNQGDFIVDEREEALLDGDVVPDDDYVGSGSDSDFDPEEYKKEKARREKAGTTNGTSS
jgi:ankyrin repeat protein